MMDVDISTYIPNGEWDLVGKKKGNGKSHAHILKFDTSGTKEKEIKDMSIQ